jgi:hypothetical protein
LVLIVYSMLKGSVTAFGDAGNEKDRKISNFI